MNPYRLLLETMQDANPSEPGYQASWAYVVLCLALPVAFGLLSGAAFKFMERVLKRSLPDGQH
ncbi:MAG: hypothetical protein FJ279_09660 [Planctomycetes bacterium]|nr:hypothetical protein [Planctomycetota bacterium]